MEAKNLQKFIDAMPFLKDVIQDDMTISVLDLRKGNVLACVDGRILKNPNKLGDSFKVDGVLEHIVKSKKPFASTVPKEFFGVTANGLLTPIFDENGDVIAIAAVNKSIETEMIIEEKTSSLFTLMEQLNIGIGEVAQSSQDLTLFIKEIADFSSQTQSKILEIDGIIQVIKSISTQSNLLALNASIEAARAGEAGRGFSVVADEMGKLSKSSKESAERVTASLLDMKHAVGMIGEKINNASLTSENQAAATQEIAASTDDIVSITGQLAKIAKVETMEEAMKH